jgi:hypothetical protein
MTTDLPSAAPGSEAKTDVSQSQQIIKQLRTELEQVLKILRR